MVNNRKHIFRLRFSCYVKTNSKQTVLLIHKTNQSNVSAPGLFVMELTAQNHN